MADYSGQNIGRYHVIEQLGEGGMAVVYKAYDTRLECDVAIKFIRTEKLVAENVDKTLKRFKIEAQKMAQLMHPNIVPVIDFGEYENRPYLVMRYLPGGNLKQKLGKPMPYQEAAHLLAPIAHALEYAHGQNIIHRDVKPANILITQSSEPMLSDFGIAKILVSDEETHDSLTGTGVGIGTPEYMAPEQGTGHGADRRSDIYALGVVFYELVTGRKPFIADTPMAVVIKQVTEPLPRPRQFVPGLSEVVEQVIFKALAKNQEDRYPSMGEFAVALEKLAFQGNTQEPVGKPVQPTEWVTVRKAQTEGNLNSPPQKPLPRRVRLPNWLWVTLAGVGLLGLVVITSLMLLPKIGTDLAVVEATRTPAAKPSHIAADGQTATLTEMINSTAIPSITVSISSVPTQMPTIMPLVIIPSSSPATVETPFTTSISAGTPLPVLKEVIDPHNATHLDSISNWGIPNNVWSIAFSPDGKLLAIGSTDNTIQLRKVSDGSLLQNLNGGQTYNGNYSYVNSVIFSPDGKMLASGSNDYTVKLWQVDNGNLIRTLPETGGVSTIAFSPDGQELACGLSDGTIRLWRIKDGILLYKLKGIAEGMVSVAFSPDGQMLASGSQNHIQFWHVNDGSLIRRIQIGITSSSDYFFNLSSIAFSPNGQMLASGSQDDTVRLWRVSDGSLVWTLQVGIVTGDFAGYKIPIIAFSPDGQMLVSGLGKDKGYTSVNLWQVSTGDLLSTLKNVEPDSLSFSPDGMILAIAQGGTIRLWGVQP
jgi:serine/threonine protein kinase